MSAAIDGPWLVGPSPSLLRYVVLGEEGAEELMILGHDLGDDSIRAVVCHAGFGGATVADLVKLKTWARAVRGCRRHGRVPWWMRVGVVAAADWVRWRVFQVAWRVWRRERTSTPAWVQWLARHWLVSDCSACEVVDHYRTCAGCVWCDNTPESKGKVPTLWDWSTPEGASADANCARKGYVPVTLLELT